MSTEAWSVPDVREAEAAEMARLPEGELMARAAHGLALVVAARAPEQARIVVLAGSGGNGGDALYAAAELAGRSDLAGVGAVLTGSSTHPGALDAARAAGIEVVDATVDDELARAVEVVAEADVVIDGIAGIGGRPGFPAEAYRHHLKALLDAVPDDAYVVAVDLPSGADPAGEVPGTVTLVADETVTFGVPKPVHVLATAPVCGLLTVVDIGLTMTTPPSAVQLGYDDVATMWPIPGPEDDKYSRGVLGIVAGGERYPGAALLTATAAVCAGVGMARYIGTSTPTALIRAQVPEVVYGAGRVQAYVVGPGLDAESDSDQVASALEALDSDLPCVVDAGALELLTGPRPHAGARTLLTPHAGELARLLNRVDPALVDGDAPALDAAGVRAAPVASARRAAELLHATVLLKGSITYVVPPPKSGLPVMAQSDAPAWAGTAGSGDVLAGLAGMLLAAGTVRGDPLHPLNVGALAALVHGLAAEAANPGGPIRALDIAHAIPRVVARLLSRPER